MFFIQARVCPRFAAFISAADRFLMAYQDLSLSSHKRRRRSHRRNWIDLALLVVLNMTGIR